MNILFVTYIAFAIHMSSVAKGLFELITDAEFRRKNLPTATFNLLASLTIPLAIIWAFLTLSWLEIIIDFSIGAIFLAPLILFLVYKIFSPRKESQLETQIKYVISHRRRVNLTTIALCLYMWLLYFGVLPAGPFSYRFL